MSKTKTTAVPDSGGIVEAVTNLIHAMYVFTRMIKTQTIKVERITDISTDALLHSVEYVDHTTRHNLAEAKKKSLV